ncbi:hypothetical protein Mame01_16610 [Microbispora amethystogenes]|nr:hypothetical protein Mame01_16610 [Microbispora amethystogenes]
MPITTVPVPVPIAVPITVPITVPSPVGAPAAGLAAPARPSEASPSPRRTLYGVSPSL